MRYALILAGGSGTRLWPMSRKEQPKQLIPFIAGRSLLSISYTRLESLVPDKRRFICAGDVHRSAVFAGIEGFTDRQFIGEPTGRDTLSALALSAAVIAREDPDAVIGVFTADHLIEPEENFRKIVGTAFDIAESSGAALMTFGITPDQAATGYGYLQLGERFTPDSMLVEEFKEKPDSVAAEDYFAAGPDSYLWNSGMFVWKAKVFLDCVRKYEPTVYDGISEIADAWGSEAQQSIIARIYPSLKKISVDFAVMERAAADPEITVAAVPMPLSWLDVGSWPAFASALDEDSSGNTVSGCRFTEIESVNNLAASDDPGHLISMIGCEGMIVIHTQNATLICPKEKAEQIKEIHRKVGDEQGESFL